MFQAVSLAVIAVLTVIDRLTKYAAVATVKVDGPKEFLFGLFNFTYVENTGAAFSLFSDKTDLPFVPDPRLVGTWDVYTFVYKPEDFDPRRQPTSKMKGMFDRIRCTEDGILYKRMYSSIGCIEMEYHYTNGVFLDDYDHLAEHYEYRKHKGIDYLIAEYKTGDYSYGGTVDIYCVLRRSTAESES